jgi:hypothetical protein
MGVTLCEADSDIERRAVLNTDDIFLIYENVEKPNTTMVRFHNGAPNALIKGTYEQNAKILFGFNRKL